MQFEGRKRFFCDDLGWVGFSLGIHFSAWRVDIHIARWVLSFGRVPVYSDRRGKRFASSNSFHKAMMKGEALKAEYLRPRI